MSDARRPRLGYILPTYEAGAASHYAHIPRLLEQLSHWIDIELVVWDCRDEPALPGVQCVHRLAATSKLGRWLELRRLIAQRVRTGCRRWFVRGSSVLALASELSGAETIYWNCGVYQPPNNWRDRLGKVLGHTVLRRASLLATAPGLGPYYQAMWGIPQSRMVLLDNDIDVSRFRPLDDDARDAVRQRLGVPADRLMLLYVHRLCRDRGADYLLPVLAACEEAGLAVTLVAVGPNGDASAPLQEHAARRPEQLRLTGAMSNADLPDLYATADLFLMPSRGEGFPRVLLESMASGTAAVTNRVGVTPVVVPEDLHELIIAEPGDIPGFCQRVVRLLTDPSGRARVAHALHERAQYYNTKLVAERYARALFPQALPRQPRLAIIGENVIGMPIREDRLNYASYQAVTTECERLDMVVTSALPAGHEEIDGAIHIHGLPRHRGPLRHPLFALRACRTVRELQRSAQPDLYWVADPLVSGLVGWYAKRRYGVPVACQIQGDFLRVSSSRFGVVKRWLMRRMLRWTTGWADRTRTVSQSIADDLLALGVPRERLVVSPSRVQASLFDRQSHLAAGLALRQAQDWADHQVLVFVGSFNDSKGLDLLLTAAASIRSECPNLRYMLVGSGPLQADLEAQAQQLGIEDLLWFPGRVPHDKVPIYLAAADAMVLPSRDEGLPRVALEAAAMELPLIITRVGGNAETVIEGQTGWLVEPTADSIATGLRTFAQVSPDHCVAMGSAARSYVQHNFDFDSNIKAMISELLHAVLAPRQAAIAEMEEQK